MKKQYLDKLYSKVMKALLETENTLEGLLQPNEYQNPRRKNETLVGAFKRHQKAGGKTVRNEDGDVEDILEFYVVGDGEGTERVNIFPLGLDLTVQDMLNVLKKCDRPAANRYLLIPRKLSLYEIEESLKDAKMPKWGNLSYKEKLYVLYQLGMDVDYERVDSEADKGREGKKDYFIDRAMYRGKGNKLEYGLVVTANERTDKVWLNTGYASEEACLYTEDIELSRDLQQIGRMK